MKKLVLTPVGIGSTHVCVADGGSVRSLKSVNFPSSNFLSAKNSTN